MLTRVIDIIRLYVVSFECVVVIAAMAATIIFPELMRTVGRELIFHDSSFQYIVFIPIVLLGVTYRLSKEMLRPADNENNRILYGWPDYWRLKYRSLGSIFFCLGATVLSLATWIFKTQISLHFIGAGLLCAILVALAATINQYLALLRLREILDGGQ